MYLGPISTLLSTLSIDPDFVKRKDLLQKMDEHPAASNWVTLFGLEGIEYGFPDGKNLFTDGRQENRDSRTLLLQTPRGIFRMSHFLGLRSYSAKLR